MRHLGAVTVLTGGSLRNESTPDSLGILFGVNDDVVVRAGGDVINRHARMLSNARLEVTAAGDLVNEITKTDGASAEQPVIGASSGRRWLVLSKRSNTFDIDYGAVDRPDQAAYLLSETGTTLSGRNVINTGGNIYANNGSIVVKAADTFRTEGVTSGAAHLSRTCMIVCRTSASSTTTVSGGLLSAGGEHRHHGGPRGREHRRARARGGRPLGQRAANLCHGRYRLHGDRPGPRFQGVLRRHLGAAYAMDVGGSWMATSRTRLSGDAVIDGGSLDGDVTVAGNTTVVRPRAAGPGQHRKPCGADVMGMAMSTRHAVAWAAAWTAATAAWAQALPPGPIVPEDPAQRLLREQRQRDLEREATQPPARIDSGAVVAPDAASRTWRRPPPPSTSHGSTWWATRCWPMPKSRPLPHLSSAGRLARTGSTCCCAALYRGVRGPRLHHHARYLGEQNLASGVLVVTVVTGKVEALQLNGRTLRPGSAPLFDTVGGGWVTDAGTAWRFPAPGDTLRLPDLEQGVDQLNRLRRNRAEMQILPGQTPGGSVVALTNPPGDRFRFNAGVDNYGSRSTGIARTRLGMDADNALGLQESFSASYVGTTDTNAAVASAALPFGYNTFSYTASLSEYQNTIGDTGAALRPQYRPYSWLEPRDHARADRPAGARLDPDVAQERARYQQPATRSAAADRAARRLERPVALCRQWHAGAT